eukprot:m.124788 g.124788  ORF g.124788 m.124788 type:complete len:770 (+) comp15720_c0_seq1:98-2407(+)
MLSLQPLHNTDRYLIGAQALSQTTCKPDSGWQFVAISPRHLGVVGNDRQSVAILPRSFKQQSSYEDLLKQFWKQPTLKLADRLSDNQILCFYRAKACLVNIHVSYTRHDRVEALLVWSNGAVDRCQCGVLEAVSSTKLAGLELCKTGVEVVSSEFHVDKSVLFWAHHSAEDDALQDKPSYKISMQRLVRRETQELERYQIQLIATQLPMRPELTSVEEQVLIFLTNNGVGLPWLLSWHLVHRRLSVQLLDGASLEPPPQVALKQLQAAAEIVPCCDYKGIRNTLLHLMAEHQGDDTWKASILFCQTSSQGVDVLRSDGRLQRRQAEGWGTALRLDLTAWEEPVMGLVTEWPSLCVAILPSQACVLNATDGAVLDSQPLPSSWSCHQQFVRLLVVTTTNMLKACVAPLVSGVQSLQLAKPVQQATHLLTHNVDVELATSCLEDPLEKVLFLLQQATQPSASTAIVAFTLEVLAATTQNSSLAWTLFGEDWQHWHALLKQTEKRQAQSTQLTRETSVFVQELASLLQSVKDNIVSGQPPVDADGLALDLSALETSLVTQVQLWRHARNQPEPTLDTCLRHLETSLDILATIDTPATATGQASTVHSIAALDVAMDLLLHTHPDLVLPLARHARTLLWRGDVDINAHICQQTGRCQGDLTREQRLVCVNLLIDSSPDLDEAQTLELYLNHQLVEEALVFVQDNFSIITLIIILRHLFQHRQLDVHASQLKALLPNGFPSHKLLRILVSLAEETATCKPDGTVSVASLKVLLL